MICKYEGFLQIKPIQYNNFYIYQCKNIILLSLNETFLFLYLWTRMCIKIKKNAFREILLNNWDSFLIERLIIFDCQIMTSYTVSQELPKKYKTLNLQIITSSAILQEVAHKYRPTELVRKYRYVNFTLTL